MRFVHVLFGLVGILSGALALAAPKGGYFHRRGGVVFVASMGVMSLTGAIMAGTNRLTVVAGLLTFYLVVTGFLTVRRPGPGYAWIDRAAMAWGLAVGAAAIVFGFIALGHPRKTIDGIPFVMGFIFGTVGLLGARGDWRMIAHGALQGPARIARHLWRLCFALWIAAASFFLGQPQVFSPAVRKSGLLAIPPLLVLFLMFFWLVRMRVRARAARVTAPAASLSTAHS